MTEDQEKYISDQSNNISMHLQNNSQELICLTTKISNFNHADGGMVFSRAEISKNSEYNI
jgi:hypothetical protein